MLQLSGAQKKFYNNGAWLPHNGLKQVSISEMLYKMSRNIYRVGMFQNDHLLEDVETCL